MDKIIYKGMTDEKISKSAIYSHYYARDVLKGRFELGEKAISMSARYSYYYARDILKGRFELGEKAIFDIGDDKFASMYLLILIQKLY